MRTLILIFGMATMTLFGCVLEEEVDSIDETELAPVCPSVEIETHLPEKQGELPEVTTTCCHTNCGRKCITCDGHRVTCNISTCRVSCGGTLEP